MNFETGFFSGRIIVIKSIERISQNHSYYIVRKGESSFVNNHSLTVVNDKKVKIAATGAATENIIRTFRTLVLSAP